MRTSRRTRLPNLRPRPQARSRRARPGIEALEHRTALTVTSAVVNGQLLVTDTTDADVITLDHSGSTTFVNGKPFADSAFQRGGIRITAGSGGFGTGQDTVNIRATITAVDLDGQFDVVRVNVGKNGSARGIRGQLNIHDLGASGQLVVDDSADGVGRVVTMGGVDDFGFINDLAPEPIHYDGQLAAVAVRGGPGGNIFTVLDTADSFFLQTVIESGFGNDTVDVRQATQFLRIEGVAGSDTVRVGKAGRVRGVEDLLIVENGGGFTSLFVDDSADTASRNVTMAPTNDGRSIAIEGLALGDIVYRQADVNFVSVKGGSGGNVFTIEDTFRNATTSNTTRIDTGTGLDQVFVHRTAGNLEINGQDAPDIVNISSALFPNGSLQGILGNVTVTNAGSRTALTVNGATDAFDRTVVLAVGSFLGEIRGLAPGAIFYLPNDIRGINLNGGRGNDTFFVQSTGSPAPVQINGLSGNDRFIVGSRENTLDEIRTPLTLNGNGGFDALVVNDQGSTVPHAYTNAPGRITRSGGGGPFVDIAFSPFESATLHPGPGTINSAPMARNLKLRPVVPAGGLATLTGRLVDPDAADTLTLTVDWGDGSAPESSTPDRKPFLRKHRYAQAGTFTVRVIWTDSAGESNSRDLSLAVRAPR